MQIYNTLTNTKQDFVPLHPGRVSLYACGITVYDYSHIGHARALIVFDVIVRYLRYRDYAVTFVRNITDVDDKIINRANEMQIAPEALAEQFIQALHEDEEALGLCPVDHEPRATQYIAQMIELIEKLIQVNAAYVAKNGDVYFDVMNFRDYGKLSHRDLENLRAGTRLEANDAKREPLDFVLWKMSKAGEPSWDSPWGKGRPGWHIECSAMSTDLLGQPFDIHGGGMDLKFPHHENEIAQSEAAHQCQFANLWMHVGLLQINGEKMSKSLGNFVTIRDALAKYSVEVIRYFMLSGHYRSPVNYCTDTLDKIQHSLKSLYIALRDVPEHKAPEGHFFEQAFIQAMDDDFNTPQALAVLFDIAHEINRLRKEQDMETAAGLAALLRKLAGLLGILQQSPQQFLQGDVDSSEAERINQIIAARNVARQNRDWAQADKLRDQLVEMGVILEDASGGTAWRKM